MNKVIAANQPTITDFLAWIFSSRASERIIATRRKAKSVVTVVET